MERFSSRETSVCYSAEETEQLCSSLAVPCIYLYMHFVLTCQKLSSNANSYNLFALELKFDYDTTTIDMGDEVIQASPLTSTQLKLPHCLCWKMP